MERHIPISGTSVSPKIIHVDSRREPCIQAADFVAGAVHRKYREEDDWLFCIIEHQCKQLFDYFEGVDYFEGPQKVDVPPSLLCPTYLKVASSVSGRTYSQ